MNHHKNGRLTAYSRAFLVKRVVEEGLRLVEVAKAQDVSVRTVYKWLRRFREEGRDGLLNRSSRPYSCPHEYGQAVQQEVIRRRHERQTYRQISIALKVGKSTVTRILAQTGLNQLANLELPHPINRYEHEAPSIRIRTLLTDNGAYYRSREFALLCRKPGLNHRFTRPYTPKLFIQTSLREWAYARSYESSNKRSKELQEWLNHYNYQRSHAGISYQPPVKRLRLIVNNVLGLHN